MYDQKMDEPANHILLYLDKNINAATLVCRVEATVPISFIRQLSKKECTLTRKTKILLTFLFLKYDFVTESYYFRVKKITRTNKQTCLNSSLSLLGVCEGETSESNSFKF